jgi:3-oxoacyl-[acyl-carrier protein] reductase
MRFTKKAVLVTGGTGGLGMSVVKGFLKEGASVATSYISDADGIKFDETIKKEFPKALAFKADVTKSDDVDRLFDATVAQFGSVDIVCNIVGGYMSKTNIVDLSEKDWDFMFSLNLRTCFLCVKKALGIMQQKKYGRIINVSAMAGLSPEAGRGAYGISKAAVATLTAIAGHETKLLSDSDVTVNAIAPSVILTPANAATASKDEMKAWVTPEQIVETIMFLSSEAGSPINGQTIKIYGKV